jgi:hypothetical protein
VVAAIDGHEFLAGFEHGLEAACANVMSGLQDGVVDSSGRPWPEILDAAGTSLGVLDVASLGWASRIGASAETRCAPSVTLSQSAGLAGGGCAEHPLGLAIVAIALPQSGP